MAKAKLATLVAVGHAEAGEVAPVDQDPVPQGILATGEHETDEHDTLGTVWGAGTWEHTLPVHLPQAGLAGANMLAPMVPPMATTTEWMASIRAAPPGSSAPFPLSMPVP